MAEDSWPSPNHNSRAVNDGEYDKLVGPYAPNGLIGTPADAAAIFGDGSGRQVKVRAARYGLVRGRLWYSGTTDTAVSVTANSSGSTRFDLVVLRYTTSTGDIRVAVIAGTPGSGPPSPVTTGGSSYDIALAVAKVASGATSLAAADVTAIAYYVGPQRIVCTSTTRPPHARGLPIYETDTGNSYTSTGSAWASPTHDSGWVAVSPASGWTSPSGGYGCRLRAVNGVAYMEVQVERTSGNITAGADTPIALFPEGYAPGFGVPVVAWNGGVACVCDVKTDGSVVLTEHPAITVGDLVTLSVAAWPIG